MNVLVTGAGGFIGRAAVVALREAGLTTLAGVRRGADAAGCVACDLDAPESLDAALATVEGVVHAAYGDVGRMASQTEALLAAMTRAGAKTLIYLSSIAVYGERAGLVVEDAAPAGRLDRYGVAKRACEAAARAWAEGAPDRRVVLLRPGIVYGTGSAFWIDKLAERIRAGAWGDFGAAGEGEAALIHVDDLAAMIAGLVAQPADDARCVTLNAVGPETPSWNAYFAALTAKLGAPATPRLTRLTLGRRRALRGPAKIWRRLGLPGGSALAFAATGGEIALFARRATYCGAKAHALGLAPRLALAEGLRRTAFAPPL